MSTEHDESNQALKAGHDWPSSKLFLLYKLSILFSWFCLPAVLALLYYVDVTHQSEVPMWMPRCVSDSVFHFYCPGCGTGRTIHSILHGRFIDAFKYNPLFVVLMPCLFYWAIAETLYVWMNKRLPMPRMMYSRWMPIVITVVFIIYTLGRNFDFWPFNYLNALG